MFKELIKKKDKITLYKGILLVLILFFLPMISKNLDHLFNKHSLRFLHFYDFFILAILSVLVIKKEKFLKNTTISEWFLFSYIIILRVSLIFAKNPIHHRAFIELLLVTIAAFGFFIFKANYFKKNKEFFLKVFFIAIFTGAFFESVIGIMQFILQKPLGFFFEPNFGDKILGSATIFLKENSFMHSFFQNKTEYLRAHGTFIHPNVLSGFLCISSLLTIFQIYRSNRKLFFSSFLSLQTVAMILTFSRAAFVSFFVSVGLFFILMLIKKYEIKKVTFFFFLFFLLVISFFFKDLLERGYLGKKFQSKRAIELNVGSSDVRKYLGFASKNMIKERPILGIGFRNFILKKDQYSSFPIERANVHNIYLLIASESGILSLIVFLLLVGIVFFKTLRGKTQPFEITIICIVFCFLFIGFFDHYPISSQFGKVVFFLSLGYLNFNKPLSYSLKDYLYRLLKPQKQYH